MSWSPVAVSGARIGERVLSIESDRNAVKVPAAEPSDRLIVVEAQTALARVTALRFEFAPDAAENAERKPLTLQLGQLRVLRGSDVNSPPINLRASEVEGGLGLAEVGKALDADANTRVAITGTEMVFVIVELDPPLAGEEPAKLRIELAVVSKQASPDWELRVLSGHVDPEVLAAAAVLAIVRKDVGLRRMPSEQKQLADFQVEQAFQSSRGDREDRSPHQTDRRTGLADSHGPSSCRSCRNPARPTFSFAARTTKKVPRRGRGCNSRSAPRACRPHLPRNRLGLAADAG